jgi:hypothetical protein
MILFNTHGQEGSAVANARPQGRIRPSEPANGRAWRRGPMAGRRLAGGRRDDEGIEITAPKRPAGWVGRRSTTVDNNPQYRTATAQLPHSFRTAQHSTGREEQAARSSQLNSPCFLRARLGFPELVRGLRPAATTL